MRNSRLLTQLIWSEAAVRQMQHYVVRRNYIHMYVTTRKSRLAAISLPNEPVCSLPQPEPSCYIQLHLHCCIQCISPVYVTNELLTRDGHV